MRLNNLKNYSNIKTFTNVDDRNAFITKLYTEGRKYFYTDKNKQGIYTVAYE